MIIEEEKARLLETIGYEDHLRSATLYGRSEIHVALRYGFWPVFGIDLDRPQEHEGLERFGMCLLYHERANHPEKSPFYVRGQLVCRDGDFTVEGFGAMLKESFTATDVYDMVRESTWPKVKPGEIVALAVFSQIHDIKMVSFKKVSQRTYIGSYTMAYLEDLTEEEMREEVNSRINKVLSEA